MVKSLSYLYTLEMLTKQLLMAPLASITHRGFREIISLFGGCDEYLTEMISASALVNGSHYESYYLDSGPEPEKTIFQVIGHKPEHILSAIDILQAFHSKGIDLNMGCSAPFLRKKGAGSAWMEKPEDAYGLVDQIRKRYPDLFLSVKIRLGSEEDIESLIGFSNHLVQSGINRLTLHPRTTKQKFTRKAQWKYVEILANELPIPVIGSGDIKTPEDVLTKELGPWSGIMIGRAAVTNPWIFALSRYKSSNHTAEFKFATIDLEDISFTFYEKLMMYQPKDFWKSRLLAFYSYFIQNLVWHHNLFTKMKNQPTTELIQKCFIDYFAEHPEEKLLTI
jgi:tRNA-dihydrouridine synthase B